MTEIFCPHIENYAFPLILRISNKYGSLIRNKFLTKSVTHRNNMTYIQNTHHLRGSKLMFGDWLKFSSIEELTYEINV
jgi:hypothetical protein